MFFIIALASIGYIKNALLGPPDFRPEHASPGHIENRVEFVNLELKDKSGEVLARLSDFKGRVILVSFWASWCGPCLIELPTFAKLAEKFEILMIVPINLDDPVTAANFIPTFWKRNKFDFQTYYDPGHKTADELKVDALPTNFVLDRQGRLAFSSYGSNDWSSPEAIGFFEALINE